MNKQKHMMIYLILYFHACFLYKMCIVHIYIYIRLSNNETMKPSAGPRFFAEPARLFHGFRDAPTKNWSVPVGEVGTWDEC